MSPFIIFVVVVVSGGWGARRFCRSPPLPLILVLIAMVRQGSVAVVASAFTTSPSYFGSAGVRCCGRHRRWYSGRSGRRRDYPDHGGTDTDTDPFGRASLGFGERRRSRGLSGHARFDHADGVAAGERSRRELREGQDVGANSAPEYLEDPRTPVTLDRARDIIRLLNELEAPVDSLPGVGPRTADALRRLNLHTVRSLLFHFPRSFVDRTQLITDVMSKNVVDGTVGTVPLRVESYRPGRGVLNVDCTDGKGNRVNLAYFHGTSRRGYGIASAAKRDLGLTAPGGGIGISSSSERVVSGTIRIKRKASGRDRGGSVVEIVNPDVVCTPEEMDSVLTIEPVYGLTEGVTQRRMMTAVDGALTVASSLLEMVPETLPRSFLDGLGWPTLAESLVQAHRPRRNSAVMAGPDSPARKRLAFEELCVQQAELALARWRLKNPVPPTPPGTFDDDVIDGDESHPRRAPSKTVERIWGRKTRGPPSSWEDSPLVSVAVSSLPFDLTDSQRKCLTEAWDDSICGSSSGSDHDGCGGDGRGGRMARLLQGDVGSGKTAIAYLLGLGCVESGQGGGSGVAAFLAPTTVLAEQHARTLRNFASRLNDRLEASVQHDAGEDDSTIGRIKSVRVELLTGGVTGRRREDLLRRLEGCPPDEAILLVGTHAMFTSDVATRLANLRRRPRRPGAGGGGEPSPPRRRGRGLALAVVDEEQRFGVRQREIMSGCAAHSLFMSATPIPRTLALGGSWSSSPSSSSTVVDVDDGEHSEAAPPLVGSMDVSTLREKPGGARSVRTSIVDVDRVREVMDGVRRQISQGAKVFWVLPKIGDDGHMTSLRDGVDTEEDDDEDVAPRLDGVSKTSTYCGAVERHRILSDLLGPDRVGLVHGRLSPEEREVQLRQFSGPSPGVDVMVGTTVLEVGVDFPRATIVVVEGAERFGLGQLHQLRGRVGRVADSLAEGGGADGGGSGGEQLSCHCVLLTDAFHASNVSGKHGPTPAARRLRFMRETDDGSDIALADFFLRGPGEVLGIKQSGIRNGFLVDASCHLGMISAASRLGRCFVEGGWRATNEGSEQPALRQNAIIDSEAFDFGSSREGKLLERMMKDQPGEPFFKHAAASSSSGIALRTTLALFGRWEDSFCHLSTGHAFTTLRQVLVSSGRWSRVDSDIEQEFADFARKLCHDGCGSDREALIKVVSGRILDEATNGILVEKETFEDIRDPSTVLAQSAIRSNGEVPSPRMIEASNFNKPCLVSDDTVFLLLDVETTGLSPKTSRIIQLAAKVYDSEKIFCEYALPPTRFSSTVEEMTGIAYDSLLKGGIDPCTGTVRQHHVSDFGILYEKFCCFCQSVRNGRNICLVAHNSQFDLRMLNQEIKRLAARNLRYRYSTETKSKPPMLSQDTGIVSTVDTLQLFRSNKLWSPSLREMPLRKPESFALKDLHQHIVGEPLEKAHNAMYDVLGLERILKSQYFRDEWREMADSIQVALLQIKRVENCNGSRTPELP